ncbi:hypothetical protein ACFIOY_31610 [Bradyrhizobium sp. TZ2]
MGCHKWHGNGGGGYGGDALSLRKTELTRDQIIEVVGCGRPGTGMPFFIRGAYDEVKCHGMNRQDAGAQMPPEGGTFLRPKDIEAVADYVIAHIKERASPLTRNASPSSRVRRGYATSTSRRRKSRMMRPPAQGRASDAQTEAAGSSCCGPACLAGDGACELSGTDGRVQRQRSA